MLGPAMGDRCLDDNDIAELLSATPAGAGFERIEQHLDQCEACRALVSDLLGVSGLSSEPDADMRPVVGADTERTPAVQPGDDIDHYRVVTLLGRGGMGDVFLARDTKLGRKVALKMVRLSLLRDDEAVARFQREARMTARFAHPNIVTIHTVGEHEGRPYVALQYLEGETLRQRLQRHRIAEGDARGIEGWPAIALSIAEALAEAHGHGMLHRDLKPDNVHLGKDARVRVLDFGLAKIAQDEPLRSGRTVDDEALDEFQTHVGAVAGTPLYMAPEQWRGEDVTAAVDVWALGTIMFLMATGERAFMAEGRGALRDEVTSDRPARGVDELAPDTPAPLVELIAQCLAKDPMERPPIDHVVAILSEHERTESMIKVGDSVVTTQRASHRLAWLVAALAVAGLVAVAFGWAREPSPTKEETAAATAAPPESDEAEGSEEQDAPEPEPPRPEPSATADAAASVAPPPIIAPRPFAPSPKGASKETLFGTRE